MDFDECIRFATEHPICAVATVDGDQPRVRMLGMWFAAKEGFYFSTAKVMRASGVVAFLDDPKLKERLLEDRPFLRPTAENIAIFRVEKGDAWFWTFSDSGRESTVERISF